MNKKIISAAIAATFAISGAVVADVTVSGRVINSVDILDNGSSNGGQDETVVSDRGSRLVFDASEDLGNGMKGMAHMEVSLDTSDAGTSFNNNRNTYVGLTGDFGTVLIGHHDSPLKMSSGKAEVFGDRLADYNGFAGLEDAHASDVVAYVSPSFSGLTVAAATIAGGQYDTSTNQDDLAAGFSVAAMYGNGPLYLAIAHEDLSDASVYTAGTNNLSDEKLRVTGVYTMDAIQVGLVYEDREDAINADSESLYVSGKYTMGNNVISAAFGKVETTGASDRDGWAIGLTHNFSKRTSAFIDYANSEVGLTEDGAGVASATNDISGFSIGLAHLF